MSKGNGVFGAIILGAITGAVVTLLSTPKTGKELRADLKDKADNLPEEFQDILSETKTLYQKTREFINTAIIENDELKEGWAEKLQKAKEVFNEQRDKIESALNAAKETIESESNPEDNIHQ